jgi:hypothetical protein
MTVSAHTGNADVDQYGDQINRLETQAKLSCLNGKALDDYDKALEKQSSGQGANSW